MNIASMLTLSKLELSVHLGWPKEERTQEQKVLIDIHIQFPVPPQACISDQLTETHCYDALVRTLKTNLTAREFRLVEHLAHEIYQDIKNTLGNDNYILICVTKQPAIANLIDGVSFYYGDEEVKNGYFGARL